MKPANRDDFRHLADGLPILVWTQRPDGTVDWVNQAWRERVSGTTPRAGWLEIVHPADLDRTTEAFARCTAAQTPFEMELRSGLNGEESGGSRLRVRVVPRFDDAGDFAGWTGTGVDVQTAHAAAERDDRGPRLRERFFSRLGVELSGALSLEQTLRVVTRSVVPEFADWALVNLRDDRGEIRLGAAYHRDTAMRGTLEARVPKGKGEVTRRLHPDRRYTAPDGAEVVLPGRSLMLVRNVGHHMMSDMVTILASIDFVMGECDR